MQFNFKPNTYQTPSFWKIDIIRNLHENPKKRILNEHRIIRYLREYNTNLIQCHNYASVGSTSAIFRCQSNEQSCQLHLATQLSTARTLNFTVKGKSYARRLLYTCSRSFLFKLYSYRNLIKIYSCANLFLVTCTIDCGNAKTFQYICTVDYVRKWNAYRSSRFISTFWNIVSALSVV